MVTVRYSGRTGNNMFQYAYARLLAEDNGLALKSDLPEWTFLRNTPSPSGRVNTGEPIHLNDIGMKSPRHCAKLDPEQAYLVEGLYEYAECYTPHRERIKGFFQLPPAAKTHPDDIGLHVRLTDYKLFGIGGTVLHPSYYTDILDKLKFRKLWIFTDEPDDGDYLDVFAKYPHEISSNATALEDFNQLRSMRRIIMSNSTFAWWAAFLGDPDEVWTPKRWMRNCDNISPTLYKIPNGTAVYNRFACNDCAPGRVSIIVPYQLSDTCDRRVHLDGCIDMLREHYGDGPETEIIIVEQADAWPIRKGALVNLGFQRCSGEIVVMLDADVRLMEKIDFRAALLDNPDPWPLLPFSEVVQLTTEQSKPARRLHTFGLVNVFWREQFEDAHGFSNLFTGWGAEDNEMFLRCGMMTRLPGIIGHVRHPKATNIVAREEGGRMARRNLWLLRTRHERTAKSDSFRQTDAKAISINRHGNVTHYRFTDIGVGHGYEYGSWFQSPEPEPRPEVVVVAAQAAAPKGIDQMPVETEQQKPVLAVPKRQVVLLGGVEAGGFTATYPRVDMVITTYNRYEYLQRTCESLARSTSMTRSKIILLDDSSDNPEHIALLDAMKARLHVVRNPARLGVWGNWVQACDMLYKGTARSVRWFVVAQDDIEFSSGWIEAAGDIIERMSRAGTDWGTLALVNFTKDTTNPYYVMERGHSGAQCLAINRKMWRQFRECPEFQTTAGARSADNRIAHWCRHNGARSWAVCHVGKSLARHIGTQSTLHDRDMSDFVGNAFVDVEKGAVECPA